MHNFAQLLYYKKSMSETMPILAHSPFISFHIATNLENEEAKKKEKSWQHYKESTL